VKQKKITSGLKQLMLVIGTMVQQNIYKVGTLILPKQKTQNIKVVLPIEW